MVSLLPSATEIVYALGLADDLVGVTFECDHPAAARIDKTVVVGGRDTSGLTPREIDDYVRGQVAAGADLYTLHAQALGALAPELILTQDLCQVCALPSTDVSSALEYLGCSAEVFSLDPHSLADVLETIRSVATAAGVPERADRLVGELRGRLESVASAVAGRRRPRVLVLEWIDPPFTAGHWVPDLVQAAGGLPVAARAGQRSAETTWAALDATPTDIVLVAPCGFGLDAAVAQAEAVAGRLPHGSTHGSIWAIDANAMIVRPGPRLVDGVEALAWIMHPDAVPAPPAGSVAMVRAAG